MDFGTEDIIFLPNTHTYFYKPTSTYFNSVTSLVSKYVPRFETEKIAIWHAKKTGRDPIEIITEWDNKREEAIQYGRKIHQYIENKLKKKEDKTVTPLPFLDSFLEDKMKLDEVYSEQIIYDENYKIAGTVDCLIRIGNKWYLYEWKTGKKFRNVGIEKMKDPLKNITFCELNRYSLQVLIYKEILKKYGLDVKPIIAHINCNKVVEYEPLDFSKEVKMILESNK
ncbi:hypothetical protein [Caldisericum sp.]|uniref:hypothetical protein n=1 Tax=Caldisericum sp. TaxID=2499687 RepID=UPI003D10DB67